ncbi:dynamin family protein [Yinghuangia seranimata]|uniref:dynamin family protein n=1 Tax=Yinghuangia seranimata TaxID=408067 RepID=UPI00248C66F6|nr:dynamin family protein [Yinghuangia seranimata]MDI2127450.1 dynamin family protein [Yinghuangia seranimata]
MEGNRMPQGTGGGYSAWRARQETLVELIDRLTPIISGLSIGSGVKKLASVRTRAASEAFKVMIVGEFKRGKSTVINAMLGDKVLPSFARPCTAIINEVMWADERSALIYPLEPDGSAGDPIPIKVEEIVDYVTIGADDDNTPNPYQRAVVRWPLELCRNGVVVVDSPGLNEAPERERVTLQYLEQADVLVFVVDCQAAMSRSEQLFLDVHVKARGHEDVFYVGNKINLVEDEEREDVKREIRKRLGPYVSRPDRVFFVNARAALNGRRKDDPALVGESGMVELERALEEFLTRERGRAKILSPARELKYLLIEAREQIDRREALLTQNVDDLRATYERVQVPLTRLEQNRRVIVAQMEGHLRETRGEVEDAGRRFMNRVIGQVPGWAREYDPQNTLGANPFKAREKMEAAVKEISDHLSGRIQVAFAEWQEKELKPLLQRRVEDLERSIDDDVKQFVTRIDEIRASLTRDEAETQIMKVNEKAAPLERLLADAVSFVLDPGTALTGGKFSLRTMLTTLLPQIAVGAIAVFVGLGPVAIFAMLLGGNLFRGALQLNKANQRMKEQVAETVVEELRGRVEQDVTNLGDEVTKQLRTMRDAIAQGLDAEIKSIRDEVGQALQTKEQGEEDAKKTGADLRRYAGELNRIDEQLADLIMDVAI